MAEGEIDLDNSVATDTESENAVKDELSGLNSYKQERYRRVEKAIKTHMKDQIEKLDKLWEKERASLDYTALKEVRFEFDQADKQMQG